MRKLSIFIFSTLNGFYKGRNEDIRWNRHGAEENEYAAGALGSKEGSVLVFGRMTYEHMAGYWPTPAALQNNPEVAKGMNAAEKMVFSRTLKKADWVNTKLVSGDAAEEMKKIKNTSGKNLTILGSGKLAAGFAQANLIDQYLVMVNPVLLGEGTPMFPGMGNKLDLKLASVKQFKSGVVLLAYEPQR